MNKYKAGMYLLIAGGLVAVGLLAVSWDRARARGETWEFGWQGAVLAVCTLGVLFVVWNLIGHARDGDQGEAPMWVVFGVGIATGVGFALVVPLIDWVDTLRTVAVCVGLLLYLAALEFCFRGAVSDELTTTNPNP